MVDWLDAPILDVLKDSESATRGAEGASGSDSYPSPGRDDSGGDAVGAGAEAMSSNPTGGGAGTAALRTYVRGDLGAAAAAARTRGAVCSALVGAAPDAARTTRRKAIDMLR